MLLLVHLSTLQSSWAGFPIYTISNRSKRCTRINNISNYQSHFKSTCNIYEYIYVHVNVQTVCIYLLIYITYIYIFTYTCKITFYTCLGKQARSVASAQSHFKELRSTNGSKKLNSSGVSCHISAAHLLPPCPWSRPKYVPSFTGQVAIQAAVVNLLPRLSRKLPTLGGTKFQ